jgi:hypothetical protein
VSHFEPFYARGWDLEDPVGLVSWLVTLAGVGVGSVLFWVASLIKRKGKQA